MYVDGLLVENHGLPAPESVGWVPPNSAAPGPQPAWDPALDELVGQNPLDYTQQPYFPGVVTLAPFPTTGGPFLVYLDVWEREVTFLEFPDLVEKAVGIDTTGRIQTAWQVRLLDLSQFGNVTCTTNDSDIPSWDALIQPSAGRVTTGVVQSASSGPCCLAPNTGYTGQENQLYRVEIHEGGTASSKPVGTFKWSRDDASVATAVTGISQAGKVLTVNSTGKDDVLRFSPNDWVEITDDWLELNGQHGELHQVALVNDGAHTITLSTAVSATSFPVDANDLTDPTRHTRLVRWDQGGKVFEADGTTLWVDLNAAGSTGDIPIPPAGTSLILENGIIVSFDLNPTTGSFNIGDYWTFAARTADGTVERLVEAPPRGIHHHYARLAILPLGGTPSDCRIEWPPTFQGGGEGCDCSACVTATSHNSGSLTIQQAIDTVLVQGGGKVCLGPGVYNITQTITIGNGQQLAQNLVISGHGLPLLLPAQTFTGTTLISINTAIDIAVEDVAFAGGGGNVVTGFVSSPAGITVAQSAFVRIERCSFGVVSDSALLSPAIAFAGVPVMNCTIRGNLFTNVSTAVGLSQDERQCFITQTLIEDNDLYCANGGVFLSRTEGLTFSEIRFVKNFVQSTSGFVLVGSGVDVAVEENTFVIAAATLSDVLPYDAAVLCSATQLRIVNNQVSGTTAPLSASDTGTGGALSAGTYIWVVTAVMPGREVVVTAPASLSLSAAQHQVSLQWAAVPGALSYNLYRTLANGVDMRLDANVAQGSGPTVTFTDTMGDQTLSQGTPLPTLQNDGFVLGTQSSLSAISMYGTQVIGNRLSALIGTGVLMLGSAAMLETIIQDNQMLALGGSGVVLNGTGVDLDIRGNSITFVEQSSSGKKIMVGIRIRLVIDGNISENRVENLGPGTAIEGVSRRGIYVIAALNLRISGNRIADIGPTAGSSFGILGQAILGRTDVAGNEVRRTTILPAQPDTTPWVAMELLGDNVNVRGNLFESFGGDLQTPIPTATVVTLESCIFGENQCFLDSAPGTSQVLVVGLESLQSIIASSNLVRGPSSTATGGFQPSMALIVPGTDRPPVTVVGNITTQGISVNNTPLSTPWAPLNLP